jgi:hypothetical protein
MNIGNTLSPQVASGAATGVPSSLPTPAGGAVGSTGIGSALATGAAAALAAAAGSAKVLDGALGHKIGQARKENLVTQPQAQKARALTDAIDKLKAEAKDNDRKRNRGADGRDSRTQRRAQQDAARRASRGNRGRLERNRRPLGEAAVDRYGQQVGSEIQRLLDSNLPFDELLMLVSALISDYFEQKTREVMGQMASQMGGGNTGKAGRPEVRVTEDPNYPGRKVLRPVDDPRPHGSDPAGRSSRGRRGTRTRTRTGEDAVPRRRRKAGGSGSGSGSGNRILSGVLKIAGTVGSAVASIYGGPAAGAAVSAGANLAADAVAGSDGSDGSAKGAQGPGGKQSEADKQATNNRLQAELQFYTQKMKQWNDVLSNLSNMVHQLSMTSIDKLKRI